MPSYNIVLSKRAEKFLDSLSDKAVNPIIIALERLSDNARPNGYIKMKGVDAYRIRVGDYRIIYEINDNILLIDVIDIGHRKNIYE